MANWFDVAHKMLEAYPLTPAKGLPMPRTVEHYQANADRDQELILEQRVEISKLKSRVNKLQQRFEAMVERHTRNSP